MRKMLLRGLVVAAIVAAYAYVAWLRPGARNMAELDRIAGVYLDGDNATALRQIDAYLERRPDDDMAWTIKGNVLEDMDRDQEAKEAHEKALSLNPKNFQSITSLGVLCRKEGNYERAMEFYKKSLDLRPDYAQAYSSMAVIELKRNNDQAALEHAKRAYEYDKEDPVIAANLAVAYHYNGMAEERDQFTDIAKGLGYRKIDTLHQIYRGEITVRDE